jgi:RNA polymerase sigma factor (sigma-70 family)
MDYMPDDRFRKPTVMRKMMTGEVKTVPGTTLKLEEEQQLFLQYNFSRCRVAQIRKQLLRKAKWDKKLVLEMLDYNKKQLEYRSKIVSVNMGLVLSMAKRVEYTGVEFTDLISEGSMALLRATEKFDCSRGLKFSTYACRAIFKAFSRAAKQCYRYRNVFPTQWDTALEKDDHLERRREEHHNYWVDEVRDIVNNNLADLSKTEMSVVKMRFSLDNVEVKPLTLKQVGEKLGLTKERIRQIQNKALMKLKVVAEESMVAI